MKKIFLLLPLVLLLFLLGVTNNISIVSAQSGKEMNPIYTVPDSSIESSVLGQNHYYSVFLRGNGEAVVSFKAQYNNTSSNPVSTITYKIPNNVTLNNIEAFQVKNLYRPPCYPYKPMPLELDAETDSKIPSISAGPDKADDVPSNTGSIIMPCYGGDYWGGGYGNTYEKADSYISTDEEGIKRLLISFPNPVQPSQIVNFFLQYRSFDFTQKDIYGTINYKFETLLSDQTIDSIQVGINAEQEYVLKDAKGKVNYTREAASLMLPEDIGSAKEVYNQELESYYSSIGQGTIYKYASHLAPNESFGVKGSYADQLWKLYIRHLLLAILVILVSILFTIFFIRRIVKTLRAKSDKSKLIKATIWYKLSPGYQSLGLSLFFSLLSAVCTVVYTIFIYSFLTNIIPYFSFGYGFEQIFLLLIIVISFGIYAAFLFIPAVFISYKRNIVWGVGTFLLTIAWLFLILVTIFIVSFAKKSSSYPGYPLGVPGYRGAAEKIEVIKPQSNL